MTKTQIETILTSLNQSYSDSKSTLYGPNIWLEMKEVSTIILGTDENVYPDTTCQVYFDTTNEIMKTRIGKYKKDGTFVAKHDPYIETSFENIVGFILADQLHAKSPYKKGAST